MKIGIIGVGGRGISFAFLLKQHKDAVLKCLCDSNPVRMRAVSKKLTGEEACYTSVEEMCKKEKLDGVIITTPDKYHTENAVAALKNGVNVLIDKPLATTVAGCKEIIKIAKASRKTAMIGFNLRHDPTLKRLKQIIDNGELGRVFLIENREFYDGGKTYMSRWNRKYEISGGLWVHKGSHDFDIFNWLLEFPKPVKVSAVAGFNVFTPENIPFDVKPGIAVGPNCGECQYRFVCPDVYEVDEEEWGKNASKVDNYTKNLCMYTSDKDVHDNGIAIVEYENGVKASHMECFVTSFTDRLYTIVGDRGQAEVSLANRTILIRPRWSKETILHQIPETSGGHGGADPGLLEYFLKVIRGDTSNTSTTEHGLWSTAIGQAAEISVRENRTVFIDELMK